MRRGPYPRRRRPRPRRREPEVSIQPGADRRLTSVFAQIGIPDPAPFEPDAFQLEAVEAVKILIDGQEETTLAGHIDLRYPFTANMLLIR